MEFNGHYLRGDMDKGEKEAVQCESMFLYMFTQSLSTEWRCLYEIQKRIAFFLALMLALLTVGCGSKSMSTSEDSATMESVYGTDYSENEYCEEPAETADTGITSGNGLEAQVENGRKLIRTVSLSLQTKEFDSVLNNLKTKTTELGGYVENSSISGNSYSYDNPVCKLHHTNSGRQVK